MMARFVRYKLKEEAGIGIRRPAIAADCKDINEAERWRADIIRDVSRLIADIQNVGLEEFEIRDLNDSINKKLRLKNHWEVQIVNLGGPDYRRLAVPLDKNCIVGDRGYKYFGVAKDLPGVREFLGHNKNHEKDTRPTRGELLKRVNIEYYGFGDEEDEDLAKEEKEATQILKAKRMKEWVETRKAKNLSTEVPKKPILASSGKGDQFKVFV
ncbi:Fringe-like, partial [Bonamia ostreae]